MSLLLKGKMVRNSFAVFLGYSFILIVQACGNSTPQPNQVSDQAVTQAPPIRSRLIAAVKSGSFKGSCCKGAPSKLRSLAYAAKSSKVFLTTK